MRFTRLHLPRPASSLAKGTKSLITIGNFDGLHLGHQALIRKLGQLAPGVGAEKVLLSFYPHPKLFFERKRGNRIRSRRLTPFREKYILLNALGIDSFVSISFNDHLAQLSPEDFVREVLVERLRAVHVVVGDDWCFGRNRAGTIDTLRELGKKYDFMVSVVPQVELGEERVSSSAVREALYDGNVTEAKRLLGRNYSFEGVVSSGASKGSKFGFPTANIIPGAKVLPRYGVYATVVESNEGSYPAVTNIGVRPTVCSDKTPVVESHILDWRGDMYQKRIKVQLIEFLREERKFANIDELKLQIRADTERAREIHRSLAEG